MLTISHLHKSFRTQRGHRKTVLYDISLTVQRGQIGGFLGPNGAGKTTTIKCLLGLTIPTSGALTRDDQPIQPHTLSAIGYAADQTAYYPELTGLQHCDFISDLHHLPSHTRKQRGHHLLDRVGLTSAAHQRVSTYSQGMKQRLGLALSLIHDPDLLIRDEPMSGLDPLGRKLIKDLMISLKHQGKTIFFSTHILSDVQEICDSFTIIHQGHTLYQGETTALNKPLDELFSEIISQQDGGPVVIR